MKNCVVKFETKEIIATKKFLKNAEDFHSEEYRELLTLTRELPDFTIKAREVYRTHYKSNYKGLTYNAMEEYLTMSDSEHLETLKMLISGGCSYFQVKEWFLTTCMTIPAFETEETECYPVA